MSNLPDHSDDLGHELASILPTSDPIILNPDNTADKQLLQRMGHTVELEFEQEVWDLGDNTHPAGIMTSVARLAAPEHHNRIFAMVEQKHRDDVDLKRIELENSRLETAGVFRDRNYGRAAALLFSLTVIGVSTYLIIHNKDLAGLIGICSTIAAIVVAFVVAHRAEDKPDRSKREPSKSGDRAE